MYGGIAAFHRIADIIGAGNIANRYGANLAAKQRFCLVFIAYKKLDGMTRIEQGMTGV